MPNYRRSHQGRLYFFTLVTQDRQPIFAGEPVRELLRDALVRTQRERPWEMTAIVLLPEHVHMIWRMPQDDVDYSTRLSVVKKRFTRAYLVAAGREARVSHGDRRHRRRGVWQQRFWEHAIPNARDFRMHLDYVHMNPVKHGVVRRACDWPHSSFQRYVAAGWYESDWCGETDLRGNIEYLWPE